MNSLTTQKTEKENFNPKPSSPEEIRFYFLTLLSALIIIISYFVGVPHYYLGWMAFAVAAFSVAGNDAIQTIGTFIESKKKIHWFPKVITLVFFLIGVHIYGWIIDNGEIHFQRLNKFPAKEEFTLLQLISPVALVIITRLRAPISTTFLILGLFGGNDSRIIESMLTKSFVGYGMAFLSAVIVWGFLAYRNRTEFMDGFIPDPEKEKKWSILQWFSTAFLWVVWLLQDTANIAVFLPRKLSILEFTLAISLISFALFLIIKSNGGTIQDVVSEKSDIQYSKSATVVDIVYAFILLVFQYSSKIPMSTTWVFLGLLAGREIILHIVTKQDRPYLVSFRSVGKDVIYASTGIIVSIGFFMLSAFIYGN